MFAILCGHIIMPFSRVGVIGNEIGNNNKGQRTETQVDDEDVIKETFNNIFEVAHSSLLSILTEYEKFLFAKSDNER